MIIGFLGKGGSGKSSLSSRFVKLLHQRGAQVLAVDADHNMDLTFNLGVTEPFNYLGSSLSDLLLHCGLNPGEQKYYEAFFADKEPEFSVEPADSFTEKYTHVIDSNLRIMTAGPHTDNVLFGKNCSHSLSTTLKVYLPFLKLQNNQYVVVDEKAGSDGAGTGISSGLDMAFIVLEPTDHGIKAAHQIAELLEFYGTPYEFIINKAFDEQDILKASAKLKKDPAFVFSIDKAMREPSQKLAEETTAKLQAMYLFIQGVSKSDRKQRSKQKFERNKEFVHDDELI